ncbi:hypothetical protein QBC37DRAFT_164801 [Rhypophila decipiens]|uniref:PNPLA domain-containing protein n=1 Tax=Rhypophila decipiens TaxID=261697 RepID=A0AAN6YGX0_9PEZI|nr:hypothetical protein QBC37DRAFT_164801 [Rhypophila decipiens]
MLQVQVGQGPDAERASSSTYEDEVEVEFREMVIVDPAESEDGFATEPIQVVMPSPNPETNEFVASQDFMDSWPRPRSDFILEQAHKAKVKIYCRVCNQRHTGLGGYVFCGGCGASHIPAHRQCLARSPDHNPNTALGANSIFGEPCQEVDFEDFIYTTWLLDSRLLDQDKESLHIDDLWSTWFGVPHDQEGPLPQLHIYPRLQLLMSGESNEKPARQYPSLVSFVGDTGSGKSTLIRAIIRMLEPQAHKRYRAPVPGTATDEFDSTSSDVHLFSDPGTLYKESPLMFVDCEGFSGTDNPVARRILSEASRRESSAPLRDNVLRSATASRPTKDLLSEHANTTSHRVDLRWGQVNIPVQTQPPALGGRKPVGQVDPETRKIVVRNLYPRLLYAFSDVVCFVTTNSRAAQTILEEMFKWAKDGHEKTLNQRVRPGLVIVLNKLAQDSQENLSTVDGATKKLLDSFQRSARFVELQKKWKARGRNITSAKDLIYCYYHSFRVIAIPQHTRTSPVTAQRISTQIKVLYGEIKAMSGRIRAKRRSLNMDLDVASLNAYLLTSVNSLALDYNNALDFHRLSDGDSALPRRFSEHLLQLMKNMVKLRGLDLTDEVGGEAKLITAIIPYIASCIVAQVVVTSDKDAAEEIQKQRDFLVDEARRGLEYFRDRYWRCESKDSTGKRRCKNYLDGHDKGHQFDLAIHNPDSLHARDARVSEENLEVGMYKSSYEPDSYTESLWGEISTLRSRGHAMDKLASTALISGVTQITGQRTCLACLSNTPTNMLPCRPKQHGICNDCIRRYSGSRRHHSVIEISECPLGCQLEKKPWTIRVKPKTAGARILVLDGGGIRGIVELAILNEIEKTIGLGIKIQDLFDLVVGTSTGGIVGLGVFEKRWTLSNADSRFRSLAASAFSLRKALRVPIFAKLAEPFCDHKYTNEGIESALKDSFGNGYLFGQSSSSAVYGDIVKVGVVTCQEGRRQPCLIANYSRNPIQRSKDGKDGYDWLQREDDQSKDFKTWQAARATSAAQTLFKPYEHQATNRTYVDGATIRNNPVRLAYDEHKRIWPSSSTTNPDIILSVGTGIHVDRDGRVKNSRSEKLESIKRVLPSGLRKKVETGLDMVEATLDCHREWVDFKEATQGRLRQNCHRLDIGLIDKPPHLDAVGRIPDLHWDCRQYLSRESYFATGQRASINYMDSQYSSAHEHIKVVARRLLAALFYLEHILPPSMKGDQYRSVIHCRLTPQTEGAVSLLALKPQFRLREVVVGSETEKINDVEFVNSEVNFDEKTLSAPVQFIVSDGRFNRFLEVRYQGRRESKWEPVGGF